MTHSARAQAIDEHIGARISLRRTLMGLSQKDIAGAIGVTFQQVQKYERGLNSMSSRRLFLMAQTLGVTIGWFFADMPPKVLASAKLDASFQPPADPLTSTRLMVLVGNFQRLPPEQQIAVEYLLESLGNAGRRAGVRL